MRGTHAIRWKRGFFRLWVLSAVLWAVFVVFLSEPWEQIGSYSKAKDKLDDVPSILARIDADIAKGGRTLDDGTFVDSGRLTKLRDTVQKKQTELEATVANFPMRFLKDTLLLLGVPSVLLVLGAAVAWVIGGFRRSDNPLR